MPRDRSATKRRGDLATVHIGTVSAQGVITALLPNGYARVVMHGRMFTGRLA